MNEIAILYTTWPDADTAERAAEAVVTEGLAACANILGPIRSVYRWEGVVERATEVAMILKTSTAKAADLRDRLASLHPYETPAILAVPVITDASLFSFVQWIEQETGAG